MAQLENVDTENADFGVDSCFGRLDFENNPRERKWLCDWDTVEIQSNRLFERAYSSMECGKPDLALVIAIRWLENFALYIRESKLYDQVFEIKDEFERDKQIDSLELRLRRLCEKAVDLIDEAIPLPAVTEEVKQDVAKRLEWFEEPLSPNLCYHCIAFSGLPSRVRAFCLPEEDTLRFLEGRLEYNFNDPTLLKHKYRLLLKMGLINEAESFVEDNIDNYELADIYIADLIKERRYDKVIPILQEITDPQYETGVRPTRRWLELLAQCQDHLGLEDAIDTYRKLYVFSKGDMQYYNILKQRVPAQDWPQFMDQMVKQTKFPTYNTSGKDNYAELLIMEGRFQALYQWLKTRKDENTFSYYLPFVPQNLRSEIYPIYLDRILAIVEKTGKREEYARVANLLAKLKDLPEGETIALGIAKGLKARFPRKAMLIGELKRALGLNKL